MNSYHEDRSVNNLNYFDPLSYRQGSQHLSSNCIYHQISLNEKGCLHFLWEKTLVEVKTLLYLNRSVNLNSNKNSLDIIRLAKEAKILPLNTKNPLDLTKLVERVYAEAFNESVEKKIKRTLADFVSSSKEMTKKFSNARKIFCKTLFNLFQENECVCREEDQRKDIISLVSNKFLQNLLFGKKIYNSLLELNPEYVLELIKVFIKYDDSHSFIHEVLVALVKENPDFLINSVVECSFENDSINKCFVNHVFKCFIENNPVKLNDLVEIFINFSSSISVNAAGFMVFERVLKFLAKQHVKPDYIWKLAEICMKKDGGFFEDNTRYMLAHVFSDFLEIDDQSNNQKKYALTFIEVFLEKSESTNEHFLLDAYQLLGEKHDHLKEKIYQTCKSNPKNQGYQIIVKSFEKSIPIQELIPSRNSPRKKTYKRHNEEK